jgi:hypothetical protein
MATLEEYFEAVDKTVSVDQVWLIRKLESKEGFKRWHQDLTKLEGERSIVKTIVVNIGQMMMQEKTPPSTHIEALQLNECSPSSPEVQVSRYDKTEREQFNREIYDRVLGRLPINEA